MKEFSLAGSLSGGRETAEHYLIKERQKYRV